MSKPTSYVGLEGLEVNPKTPEELWMSIDALHTMVMDNMSEDDQAKLLPVLEMAMSGVESAYPNKEFYF